MIKNLWNIDPNGAIFSPCRTWRYRLHRIWHPDKPMAAFIGLNPSTADEVRNDPTVTRCVNYARCWGYGGLVMLNIFAYRATAPRDLKAALSPVGELNDLHIFESASRAALVVAAWGTHGEFMGRGEKVQKLLFQAGVRVYCLGKTNAGYPRHPLYLAKNLKPILFQEIFPGGEFKAEDILF